MRISALSAAAAGAILIAIPLVAHADPGASGGKPNTNGSFTYAVYGDAPYGINQADTSQTTATPAFIERVNADPDVSTVVHVGDIHSGKQFCTEDYDRQIAGMWTQFADPLVYTPGDNEWADCNKSKEGGGTPADYANGDPLANLDLVRSIFFPAPGATLGSGTLQTISQATAYDPAHPEDQAYVENTIWQRKGFVFVTLNVPGGSNNDTDPWFGAPITPRQTTEVQQRTDADLRWLDHAFDVATAMDAQGLVVIQQADMWDRDFPPATDNLHLTQFEPLVASLADHTAAFGKPVLHLVGDSHIYRSDNPLQNGAPCTGDKDPDGTDVCAYGGWSSHPYYDVANFHRVVVHGSITPLEYLKLVVTPGGHQAATATTFGPFSWSRQPQS